MIWGCGVADFALLCFALWFVGPRGGNVGCRTWESNAKGNEHTVLQTEQSKNCRLLLLFLFFFPLCLPSGEKKQKHRNKRLSAFFSPFCLLVSPLSWLPYLHVNSEEQLLFPSPLVSCLSHSLFVVINRSHAFAISSLCSRSPPSSMPLLLWVRLLAWLVWFRVCKHACM